MTDIPLALGGLKTAIDVAKSLIGVRDQAVIQSKVIDLNRIILQAQEDATDARAERDELKQTIRTLKADIEAADAWNREAARYTLKQVGIGVVLYAPIAKGSEPDHYLCPNCFSQRKKSFVQKTQATRHGNYYIHKCTACSADFEFEEKPSGVSIMTFGSYDSYSDLSDY